MKRILLYILLAGTAIASGEENGPQIAVAAGSFNVPAEVRGRHFYLFRYDGKITIEDIGAITATAEEEWAKTSGFRSDLVITIQGGTTRRRRTDGGRQRPSSRYNISVQHVEKYFDDGRPFASTLGLMLELDTQFKVIPLHPPAQQGDAPEPATNADPASRPPHAPAR